MQTAEGCTANGLDDFEKINFWTTPGFEVRKPGRVRSLLSLVSDYIGVIGGR